MRQDPTKPGYTKPARTSVYYIRYRNSEPVVSTEDGRVLDVTLTEEEKWHLCQQVNNFFMCIALH
jgi:hypothetical protein